MIDRMQRWMVPMLLGVAAYYAVFGGEYSVFEVRAAKAAVEVERAALENVKAEISTLTALADSLEHDPATIERVAREAFGMVREGETLYRFADPDRDGDRPADAPER